MVAGASAASNGHSLASTMKGATSMQQLKDLPGRPSNMIDQTVTMMDDDQLPRQQQSTLSIPDVYEQQLINERLMCIQQMMGSGQNFASMFNDDPHFAQQIMACISAGGNYAPNDDDPDVIEIMDQ